MNIFHRLDDPDLCAMLRAGKVGVLPTDTLYGLVASASNPAAVERMYELKHRERKPGTTIAASVEQLADLGIDQTILDHVAYLWPAPLSLIMPLGASLTYIHQGVGESPFRVVADEKLRALLQQTGPLVTSSANQPGQPPARNFAEAQHYFGEQVDFYVDGGDIGDREPSTIARVTASGIEILRQGAAHIQQK